MKDEERKTKKEALKRKVDEMSDEELDKAAGGGFWDNLHNISSGAWSIATPRCFICNKTFSSEAELAKHNKENH